MVNITRRLYCLSLFLSVRLIFMADDIEDDEDEDTFVGMEEDELLDEQDDEEDKEVTARSQSDARRRLEQLREDRELERLINGDYYDWN